MRRLLLLSNSTNKGQAYLEHAAPWIREHFKDSKKILFIPYAEVEGRDAQEAYAKKVASFFATLDIEVISAHHSQNPIELLEQVQGIFVGGGSTPYLLKTLGANGLLEAIPEKVRQGMPYLGSSAGTVICCPTIMTTNDMCIVRGLSSLDAMHLIPFQINAHHPREGEAWPSNIGESRDERLKEYHALESTPVVGLREGSALLVEDDTLRLLGPYRVRYFQPRIEPLELMSEELSLALAPQIYCPTERSTNVQPAGLAAAVSTAPHAAFMPPAARLSGFGVEHAASFSPANSSV